MPVQPKQLSGLFLALTPVTYRLTGAPTVELFGYLDEQVTPLALYSDMNRQVEVVIGTNPTEAIASSIKTLVSDPVAIGQGIDGSGDINSIVLQLTALATELATGNALADKVGAGINASSDINALITALEELAANSIEPVSGRLPVAVADMPGEGITGESIGTGGSGLFGWLSTISSGIRQILNDRLPALVSGRIPVDVEPAISTDLASIIARLSNTKAFQTDWVERKDTGEPLRMVSSLNENGGFSLEFYLRENGTLDPNPGAVRPLLPGRSVAAATNWGSTFSDSELMRRFFQSSFPLNIERSAINATAVGLTQIPTLSVPAGQRITIVELTIQSNSATANTVILKSVGTSTTDICRYRLAGDGAGINNLYQPGARLKAAPGATISIELATASSAGVFCQLRYFLEDATTGLPVTA